MSPRAASLNTSTLYPVIAFPRRIPSLGLSSGRRVVGPVSIPSYAPDSVTRKRKRVVSIAARMRRYCAIRLLHLLARQVRDPLPRELPAHRPCAFPRVWLVPRSIGRHPHDGGVLPQRVGHPDERRWAQQAVVGYACARVGLVACERTEPGPSWALNQQVMCSFWLDHHTPLSWGRSRS